MRQEPSQSVEGGRKGKLKSKKERKEERIVCEEYEKLERERERKRERE